MTTVLQTSLSFTISWSLLRFMSINLVMLSYHLILCCTLLFLPSIFPSIRVFSNESALPIRWPKYWSFSFKITPSSEYSGLISFKISLFVLLIVQGTLKILLRPCNLKASILLQSAFFMVQFLHPYITTGKTIDLIICSFVSKVMFLLFNKLSMFVTAFLPGSKHFFFFFFFSFMSGVCSDFGAQEKKICHCFYFFHFCLLEVMGTKCHDLSFFEC